MPLHVDYRPKDFADFYGNRSVLNSLKSLVENDNHPHSYLFTGPAGCGKTTLARILADKLGCTSSFLQENNSADFRGIDSVRDILGRMKLAGNLGRGKNRGWLLDECHKLTNDAENALLKALEEPPPHVYFFLCTTDPQNLLKTTKSRCTTFELQPLSEKQLGSLLRDVMGQAELEIPDEVVEQISHNSEGSPRTALTTLEKVSQLPEREMLREAKKAVNVEAASIDLCRALIDRKDWKTVAGILKGLQGEDPESVRRHVIGYASSVLLNGKRDAYLTLDAFREPFYDIGRPGLVLACYEALEGE